MALRLADFEAAPRHEGEYGERLVALQSRLRQAHFALLARRRSAIVVVEGWAASGRAGVIRRMVAQCDPCRVRAWRTLGPTTDEAAHHWLRRFWERLPATGEIALFDRGWHARLLADRVEGRTTKADAVRVADEINEFEARQGEAGTTIVKLFLHITAEEQARRLRRRLAHPWKHGGVAPDDLREHERYAGHAAMIDEMLARTDTRWSPWTVIDAGRPRHARLAALARVVETLEAGAPAAPPAVDAAVLAQARRLALAS